MAEALVDHVKGAVVADDSHGQTVVHVPRDAWREAVRFLKEEQQFTQCSDITAVDQLLRPDRPLPAGVDRERFEVVANFLSHPRNRRIRLICQVPDGGPGRQPLRALPRARSCPSGRSTTSSACASPGTPTWPACSCPTTGRATRSARTTPRPGARPVQGSAAAPMTAIR